MKEKIKDWIVEIIVVAIIGTVVIGLGWSLISDQYEKKQLDKNCLALFPSPLKKDIYNRKLVWHDNFNVEEGYIKCCRRYAEDHEIKQECEIFHEGTLAVRE